MTSIELTGYAGFRSWWVGHSRTACMPKQLKGAKKREYVLPLELEQKYLDACTEPLRTVAVIMLDAGMRPAEIYSMRWTQVRFSARRPAIAVKGTKTAAAVRNVPMSPRVRAIMSDRWDAAGKPLDGWVFPAKRRRNDHIIDNTVMEPHWNAAEKSGIGTKDSNCKQSMTYVHPSQSTTERAFDDRVVTNLGTMTKHLYSTEGRHCL